jgi:predicted molibdopterin-dependent oxidoreductase YjgC
VSEHFQGSEAVMLLCDLALLAGAVGREGAGVNPLRGQNNVQGAADMGCQPDLLTGYAPVADPGARARFERVWGRPVPAEPGHTIPRILEAAARGEIRAMFVLGEDLLQSDPHAAAARGLGALDFLVVQDLFLTETASLAHLVLPGASFLEKDGTFTSAERRIQRVRKALEPPGEARADWETLLALMEATGLPQPFRGPADVLAEVARVAPDFAGVSFERLEGDGLPWPVPSADHPGTEILHREGFPAGRAELACVEALRSPSLEEDAREGTLLLTTGRVLEHYNAGSWTRRSPAARLRPRDELELHADDAASRGVRDGARVAIRSRHGEARAVARVRARIARGTAFLSFHYPETGTNRLVGGVRDRLSDCPELKLVPVVVVPEDP